MELEKIFGRPPTQTTIHGAFITSSIEMVNQGLKYFIGKGTIDTNQWFCDAGCGDGRVLALTAGQHKIPSLGIESDPSVYKIAENHLYRLHKKKFFQAPAKLSRGNFMVNETYQQQGLAFTDIVTFFNYINNQDQLAAKINQQSPHGTILIIYDSDSVPKQFPGLKFLETKKVPEGWEISADYYFHAYKKE